jgi:hypothetical protein
MTEQEIEQARADVDQLDIEQLRCGVLLQLLHIEALKKERDALALGVDQWRVDFHELRLERDALMAAGKMALDALEGSTKYFNIVRLGESRLKDSEVRGKCHEASTALRQAGVQ